MQDRPTAAELLATVATYLEAELMPALDGPLAYRTRVAANLVRTLEREQSLGAASLVRECELLAALLDQRPLDVQLDVQIDGPLEAQVADLNRRVTAAIDEGKLEHARVWPALMEIAHAKLAIIRPGYDDYDAHGELP